jgi:hypothetical protein
MIFIRRPQPFSGNNLRISSSVALKIARSVIKPVTNRAAVTSKAYIRRRAGGRTDENAGGTIFVNALDIFYFIGIRLFNGDIAGQKVSF